MTPRLQLLLKKMMFTLPSFGKPLEIPLVAATSVEKAGFFKTIRDSISYLIWGKV
jgi:hypothetical protein